MNQNSSSLALHSDNIINLPRDRPFFGAAKAAPRFIAAGIAATLILAAQTTLAGSATWDLNPTSNWNTATNWTPNTVPNGPTNVATFAFSNTTAVSLSANTEVNEIAFNSGASGYTVTASPSFSLTISGAGITNNSGIMQNFVTSVDPSSNGLIFFRNSATAGDSTAFTNNGAVADFASGAVGGRITFEGTSSAAYGTFTNNGGTVNGASGGEMYFYGSATAGNGNFTINGGTVSGAYGGFMQFADTSTASNSTLIINGGAVSGANGGGAQFVNTSTASNCTLTANGGTVGGAEGSFIQFLDSSTAGNATLIANSGSGGGGGGAIHFYFGEAIGATARVKVFGNGYLDIVFQYPPGLTIGSLEGDGDVSVGGLNLTVGSNNLSTVFSGVIDDQGGGFGPGSLTKIGSGTLRLSDANTYSGTTTVSAGRLLANNSTGSGTGTGDLIVFNGHSVLGGSGRISGPVTINSGAALLGGNATTATGALRVGNNLTLNSGAIIQLVLGASGAHSSLRRTGGTWSFAPNQEFTFLDLGAQPGVYDNIITGLAANPGGVASWTITNAGFTGTLSYDGAGNIDLNLTAASGPVLQLTAAVSRKMHGGLGPFDINLPLTGGSGVECRSSGGDHTLRFTFTNNVTSGNASITTGIGTVSGTPTFAGKNMTVNLTGVADVQKITVTLSNVTDNFAQVLPDKAVSVNMLIGDTTGNKTINASDIGQTKGQSGAPVTAANFRQDVTVSGSINASDIGLVKSRSGAGVP